MRVPEGKYTQRGMVKKRNEEEFRQKEDEIFEKPEIPRRMS